MSATASVFEQACQVARASYLQGSAVLTRQCVDVALEVADGSDALAGAEGLALLSIAVETDVVLAQYDEARRRLHAGLLRLRDLPTDVREDARLRLQALQLLLALKEGNLPAAAEVCITAFRPASLELRGRYIASGFARFVAELLRELGLLGVVLDLVNFTEQRLLPMADPERIDVQLALQHLRIATSLQALGRSLRFQGPLGWDEVAEGRAQQVLQRACEAVSETITHARAQGLAAHAAMASMLLEAARGDPSRPEVRAERIRSTRQRLKFQREAGFLCDVLTAEIELVGLLVTSGELSAAWDGLRRTRAALRQAPHPVRLEEWYWQMHRYQREVGHAHRALMAFQRYAALADARRRLASRFLVQGHHILKAVEPTAASETTELEAWLRRMRTVAETADSVEALAAGMNLTPRRLQQLLRAHGLPPPAAHLRAAVATRRRAGTDPAAGPETQWGTEPR